MATIQTRADRRQNEGLFCPRVPYRFSLSRYMILYSGGPVSSNGVVMWVQEVVGEEDAQLKNLREEWGEEVLEAVKIALDELNENNASGRYSVPTQWNFKAKIKSTRKEVIEYMTASDRKFQEETKVLGNSPFQFLSLLAFAPRLRHMFAYAIT